MRSILSCQASCSSIMISVQEERDSFSKLLLGGGFTDAWRRQHPDVTGYTYWNYRFNTRASNKGWRLDYFLVRLMLISELKPDVIRQHNMSLCIQKQPGIAALSLLLAS